MPLLSRAKDLARSVIMTSPVPLRVVRDVRTEAHLAGVRFRRHISPGMRARERALMRMNDVKLHFGCGPRILPGWANIDGWNFPGIDFETDLRQPLPFSDASCQLIFTEHVFEHIDAESSDRPFCASFFAYCDPEEPCRIVVPDCEQFVNAYIRHDIAWFQAGLGWPACRAEGLNNVFTRHTHRVIDDWESLSASSPAGRLLTHRTVIV